MATQNQVLTFDWVEVKSALSLSDLQKYTFQNTGSFPIRVVESASEPTPHFYGHQLEQNDLLSVTPAAGVNVYVKVVAKGMTSNLTVTEAV
jgi:hypothetical protein